MYWQTAFIMTLLASRAKAGIQSLVAEGVVRNTSPELHRRLEATTLDELDRRGLHDLRQAPKANGFSVVQSTLDNYMTRNPDGSVNMTAWDAQTSAACEATLSRLPAASNPSGACVCYNLPALNNVTGAFEADLRLYRVSQATGPFQGISPQNIQVGLNYIWAAVTPVSMSSTSNKARVESAKRSQNLQLLQKYYFVGQIDKAQMVPNLQLATLESLVLPTVTLSGPIIGGLTLTTNLSVNEASFVVGVFSRAVVLSDTAAAQQAVDRQVQGLAQGAVAFVLPGVNILIFPIGLVITSIWTLLGVGVYAAGTVSRMKFAESYRKSAMWVNKTSSTTF